MKVLAFGGGTDSTAILCGWVERGLEPFDLILFADTGGERPHTYEHIERMQEWLRRHGMPPITIVRKVRRDGRVHTLEENCLESKMLPSLAYGFKSCSQKFKIAPQEKFVNNFPQAKELWRNGGLVDKYIGYEFGEKRRWMAAPMEDEKYRYHYPLVEWEWSRPECVAAIERAGLPLPGKSSCFFCPASKKPEIAQLKQEYPVLFARALAMEDNAELTTVKGLGRRFSWRDYATTLEEPDVVPCISCADGSNTECQIELKGERNLEFTQFLESLPAEGETLLYVRQKPLTTPPTFHENGAMKSTYPAFKPSARRREGEAWYANTASYIEERLVERVAAAAANCEYCLVMVLDDIGTKSKTPPLEPTWKMETSAGNYQWGYAFDFDHQPKKADFAAAIRAIADAGYTDPGACNPVRNFRIPGSVNTKQGREAFEARLEEFHPDRFFTLEQICAALGVTPGEALHDGPRPIKVKDDGNDDVFAWLNEHGMVYSRPNGENWAGVLCPNASEHTDGSPEGRYMPSMRAYCCLHGHCTDWDSERFLTWVAAQGGPARSLGLREELVQARLASALPAPPEGATEDARRVIAEVDRKEAGRVEQAGWYKRFAYVLPDDCYFDLQERTEVSRSAFNALFRHVQCWSIHSTPGGRPKKVEASISFDENRQAMGARTVQGVTYAAGEMILCARDGQVFANRWRDARPDVQSGGDPTRWLEHVERMIPDPVERNHVLDVMAFKVQNPRVKVNHAILHGGTAGAGKDTMWAPFFWAIGGPARRNIALLENDRLQTQWGYHLEAEVIVINELRQADATDRRALENRLKSIIAAPPELLVVERKGLHPYMIPNRAQVVCFTNERGAISLSAEDRRWFVTWTHAGRMDPDAAREFWHWLEAGGGFEAVAGWLRARDVSTFNPGAAPAWTDAKEAMLSAARPLSESWLLEQIEGRKGEFASGLASGPWSALCDRLQGLAPAGTRIAAPSIIHALSDAKWLDLGMCHSKANKTKRHIWCAPDWRGSKAEARDATERPAAGPLTLVKTG